MSFFTAYQKPDPNQHIASTLKVDSKTSSWFKKSVKWKLPLAVDKSSVYTGIAFSEENDDGSIL